jgi:hypothetical protein
LYDTRHWDEITAVCLWVFEFPETKPIRGPTFLPAGPVLAIAHQGRAVAAAEDDPAAFKNIRTAIRAVKR